MDVADVGEVNVFEYEAHRNGWWREGRLALSGSAYFCRNAFPP
jgi:hypothetical protein